MQVRQAHPTPTPPDPGADPAAASVPTPAAPGLAPGDAAFDIAATVRRASAGDQKAWAALVRAYSGRVFALAKSRCRNEATAEEITQSVFVTVATKLSSGHYAEQGKFEPWLFRVAMNRIRDEMRRLKRHATPTDPATLTDMRLAEAAPPRADARELGALRDALDLLTGADREVIELRHHAGLSFQRIAEMLDQPMGTVLARHHRALKKLRTIIEEAAPKREKP